MPKTMLYVIVCYTIYATNNKLCYNICYTICYTTMLYLVETPLLAVGSFRKEKVFLDSRRVFSKLHFMCSRSLHSILWREHHSMCFDSALGVLSEEIQWLSLIQPQSKGKTVIEKANQNQSPAEDFLKKSIIISEPWLLTQPVSGHGPQAWVWSWKRSLVS